MTRYVPVMGALADCERIVGDLIGQPINTLTTLAFVIGGLIVIRFDRGRLWIGIGLIATGAGSLLFHGPMPTGSEWAHDVTLAWLIVLIGAAGTRYERLSRLPALATLGIMFAWLPEVADPVAVLLAVVAVTTLLIRDRSNATLGPLGLIAIAAVLGRLGATAGPWCYPDSVWQWHGLWHVAAAGAVTWWALASSRPRR